MQQHGIICHNFTAEWVTNPQQRQQIRFYFHFQALESRFPNSEGCNSIKKEKFRRVVALTVDCPRLPLPAWPLRGSPPPRFLRRRRPSSRARSLASLAPLTRWATAQSGLSPRALADRRDRRRLAETQPVDWMGPLCSMLGLIEETWATTNVWPTWATAA